MKSMKKSMFVTTILMVVLLIVALSTATFAWYTANTTVGATKTTVTSASSSSASLVIDNQVAATSGATNDSVTLTMTGSDVPMVYAGAAVSTSTTYSAFTGAFKTFTKDANNKFASVPGNSFVAPKTISAVTGSADSSANIVLTNVGGIAIDNVDITVTIAPLYVLKTGLTVGTSSVTNLYTLSAGVYTKITDAEAKAAEATDYYEAHDYLNVAVFAGATEGALTLKGIYGASSAQRAAAALASAQIGDDITTVVGNATLSGDLTSNFKSSGNSLLIAQNVGAFGDVGGYSVVVKVVAWFEGVDMLNIDASKDASFTLSFTTRANS